jgi:hypothetical protein
MDIVKYFNDLSREESLKIPEVKEYSDRLDSEITRIQNFRCNKNVLTKIIFPISSITSNIRLRKLKIDKENFLRRLNSDVLLYDHSEFDDILTSLECTAKFYKPVAVRDYVVSKTKKKK